MHLIPTDKEYPKAQPVVNALRDAYLNGGVILATFSCRSMKDYDSAQDELRAFLDSPGVRRALHFLKIPHGLTPLPTHSLISSITLQSDVTSMLQRGGAYTRGVEGNSQKLAASFCGGILGDRQEIRLFRVDGAWSPWFYDVAWDYTCIMKIPSHKRWVVFCCTDTD